MRTLLDKHASIARELTESLDPHRGYRREMWGVRHGRLREPGIPAYHVTAHLPPDFSKDEIGLFRNPLAKDPKTVALVKAVDANPDGSRWITIHPHGEDEKGQPVLIHPNPDGSHTIVRGAGGALNGLRLTGVKSEEEYKHLARQRREEKKEAMRQKEVADRQRLGAEAYAQRVADKQQKTKEIAEAKRAAERQFVEKVFEAQGIDKAHLDIPKEKLAGVADDKTAQRLLDKHHQKLVTYAKAVAGSVKEIVRDGLDQLSTDSAGELGVSDLVNQTFGGGNGYASPAKVLAADLGLDAAAKQEAVAGFRFRDLLERNDMNVGAAAEKREQIQGRTDARKKAESKLKQAAQELAKEGAGPEVVKQFSEVPKVESMAQAVDILKAARMADQAGQAAQSLKHELDMADDLDKLPRASVVVAKPMSDAEAKDAIAATLGEESMQHAMTRLVKTSNDLEREYGTLRQHYSVGAALAFNTIAQAVDGQTVDPMLHDILGTSGAAAAIVAGWRQSLGEDGFAKLKDVLAKQHIKTQEDLANTATDEANEYLDQHEELIKNAIDPDSPEGLAAAVQQHAERTELLARARESVGVARGRLEAAAALNEAMMKAGDKPVQISLGNMPLGDALANCYALGLTDPVKFDKNTGEVQQEGDYELSRDAENTILTIHPSGLSKLTRAPDPELIERADRSAAIKAGKFDEPDWLPKGISDRPRTSYNADPLERNSIDHQLELTANMTGPRMADAIKGHIGALLNAGRDPDDIASKLRSEEFVGGLNLSPEAEARYLKAVNEVAPVFSSKPGLSESERVEEFKQFQEKRKAVFSHCLAQHLAAEAKAGRLNAIAAGLDKQTVPTDARTHDALYVAALADPRTRFAFHKFGDLGDDGRAAVRAYAYEHLFGMDPKTDGDQIITPLTDQQRKAFEQWREFDHGKGDPYSVIQEHWRKQDEDNAGLFGEPEIHPIAAVDMTNDAAVVEAAHKSPQMLGYKPMRTEGKDIYPELEVGSRWVSDDGATWRQSDVSDRTEESVAQDARTKIKGALRQHWLKNMLGMSDLAESGWSPTSVKTAGDRWGEYASHMGEEAAYKTVQEFMAGDLVQRFASEHAARGGQPFSMASRPVDRSEQHAVAMLPPAARERLNSMDQTERANLLKRVRGRWVKTGSLKDKQAIAKVMEREAGALFAVGKDEVNVKVNRPTIGRSAEAALAGMLPSMDTARKMQAASGIKMSGQFINQQRAIKLLLENKRMGVALGVGSGKSVVSIGAFTQARHDGNAKRAIFTVPSNIVGQFSDEIYKYHDPSTGLRWAHTEGKSSADRLKMLKDSDTHIVITTPEAMREDITQVVANHLGVSKTEARDRIMAEDDENKRNKLIHAAMDAAGIHFDFCAQDESHRMLDRAGKPDAHMARVGDAVAAKSKYFADLTADPVKNDASEIHSKLNRIDPKRYPESSRGAFLRRYGRQTIASGLALQQEMQPYIFADKIDLGIDNDHSVTSLDLTRDQQKAHDGILDAYKRARSAKRTGGVDIDALKQLSPNSFKKGDDEETVAKNLNRGLATLRDMALSRVVNSHPGGAKENAVSDYAAKHKGEGIVVFAHNLDAVKSIAKRLKAEGHRVGILTGEMSGKAKNAARLAFNPDQGEPSVDVLVSSDAGAQGANLQRGAHLINVDVPLTSMIHQQRIGRILRPGQKASTVRVRDLVTKTDHDTRARRRLEAKAQLRELTTSPASAIDDSGLGHAIEQAQIRDVLKKAQKKKAA
jgi:superfamily II DNA or RNA helicase